jgi:hypothetical protein
LNKYLAPQFLLKRDAEGLFLKKFKKFILFCQKTNSFVGKITVQDETK